MEAANIFVCHRWLSANHRWYEVFARDHRRDICCTDWLRSTFYCYSLTFGKLKHRPLSGGKMFVNVIFSVFLTIKMSINTSLLGYPCVFCFLNVGDWQNWPESDLSPRRVRQRFVASWVSPLSDGWARTLQFFLTLLIKFSYFEFMKK